ncbi:hypothetical protein [Kiloniella antarctica]|uniref:Uncharacterized protein n=1 Tax=Kiloniella antarctica TaxID=1550907 RepID=A0ABW5BN02_9PROT
MANALWDNLEHRTEAFASGIPHQDQIMQMRDCTNRRHPEVKLVVTDDLLLPAPKRDPRAFAHSVLTEKEKETMRTTLTSKQAEISMTVPEDHLSSLENLPSSKP